MTKRKELTAILIFLLLALLAWSGLSSMPKAELVRISDSEVVHDLRDFDFENNIALIDKDTMWETYPEKLYMPEDFTLSTEPLPANEVSGRLDYVTFRLPLLLMPGQTYGFSLRSADFTMRIYIDGIEIDSVGIPGTTRETTMPRTDYRVYYFMPKNEQTDIILHVSNFVHRKDASIHDSYLGSPQNINRKQQADMLLSLAIFGSLFTSGLYHLALFLVNRRRTTELIFSVCCFTLMLMNQQVLFLFFPLYNWFVMIRVEYVVHYTAFAMVIYFMYKIFPKLLQKCLVRGYLILSGALILTAIIADMTISSHIIRFYDAGSVFLALWVLIRLSMLLIRSGRLQNLLGFLGMLVLTLLAVNDMLIRYTEITISTGVNLSFTAPVGMVFFMLCHAMAMALNHAETERKADKVNFYRQMSHQLRTPLTIVSTNIQTAKRRPEEADELLTHSQAEIMKMADMIDQALQDDDREADK